MIASHTSLSYMRLSKYSTSYIHICTLFLCLGVQIRTFTVWHLKMTPELIFFLRYLFWQLFWPKEEERGCSVAELSWAQVVNSVWSPLGSPPPGASQITPPGSTRQIHFTIWKNTLWDLENTSYDLEKQHFGILENKFWDLVKYIWYVAMVALGLKKFMTSCLLLVVCWPKQGELGRRLLQMLKVVLILWELHLNCTALCIFVFECRQCSDTNTQIQSNKNA